MQMIRVASDFTPFPGGRYKKHGKGSGEEFRENFLVPLMKIEQSATIDLDGTSGYPPSFLEEAFGGLVRAGYSAENIRRLVKFQAGPENETYIAMIMEYIDREARRAKAG